MAYDKEELKKRAKAIRDEYRPGANTAYRIGTMLMDIIDQDADWDVLTEKFLRKDKEDTAHKHITFEEGITVYELAKMMNLEVTELATIAQAVVQILRSSKFVDGFAGEGYQIWQNIASGDWNFTIDNITVRKCMTIYELIVQKIRSVGGMIVVSAANGKVKSVTLEEGRYLITFEDENLFQPHDLMRCQVFTGRDVRYYWVEIAEVDGDTVVVLESEFAGVIPAEGDECVLMGNTVNYKRQNLILISATEDGQPRIDVLDGVHEKNFNGCLRTRLGALSGISDSNFPADMQPSGYGLYSNNCFLTGMFVLANGKDVMTMFAIMEGMIKSEMASIRYDMNVKDNYLANTSFAGNLTGWTLGQGIRLFKVNNRLLAFNRNFYANKQSAANIATYDGRYVLRIKGSSILQRNADFAKHPEFELVDQVTVNDDGTETVNGQLYRPKMFYVSFRYMVQQSGTLRIYFKNESGQDFEPYTKIDYTKELPPTTDFQIMEVAGKWDGTGDFYLAFTGDIYIYQLFLAGNPLADFSETYNSSMELTDKRLDIAFTHIKKNGEELEKYQSEFQLTAGQLRLEFKSEIQTVTTKVDGLEKTTGTLSESVSRLELSAERFRLDFNRKIETLDGKVQENQSSIEATAESITLCVKKGDVISAINQSAESVTIDASKINLNGTVTANGTFRIELDGTFSTTAGRIGGFRISGNGLTNSDEDGKFTNDAYIIFRNDEHRCFAGIGGNVLPTSSGLRSVARFENHDTDDWWGLGCNYAMVVSAQGVNENVAIAIGGGCVSGFAVKTLTLGFDYITQTKQPTTKSYSISRDVVSLYVSTHFYWRSKVYNDDGTEVEYSTKTREMIVTLPTMEPYDDGHVIKIKRGVNNGNYVRIKPGYSRWREFNETTLLWETKYGTSYILYDNASYGTPSDPMTLNSEGDACELVFHRDLVVTIEKVKYHGCWIQHKHPRVW